MKKIISNVALLGAFLASSLAQATISTNQIYQVNNQMGAVAHQIQLGTLVQNAEIVEEADVVAYNSAAKHLKRLARVVWDATVSNGGSSTVDSGAHALGVSLPASTIIQRTFFYATTQPVSADSGTLAFHCGTANNIYSDADVTGITINTITEGVSTGTTTNMKFLASACDITATVATANYTAGKLVLFIEYVIAE